MSEERYRRPPVSGAPADREIPGLVWGAVFAEEGMCSPLGTLDRDRLEGRSGLVWLHLALSDQRVPALLATLPDLPAFAIDTPLERRLGPVRRLAARPRAAPGLPRAGDPGHGRASGRPQPRMIGTAEDRMGNGSGSRRRAAPSVAVVAAIEAVGAFGAFGIPEDMDG